MANTYYHQIKSSQATTKDKYSAYRWSSQADTAHLSPIHRARPAPDGGGARRGVVQWGAEGGGYRVQGVMFSHILQSGKSSYAPNKT